MRKSLPFFIGAFILFVIAHYIYIWDRNRHDKNLPEMHNIEGKRVYVSPSETGIHVVLIFISTLMLFMMTYIGYFFHDAPNSNSNGHSLNMHQMVDNVKDFFHKNV